MHTGAVYSAVWQMEVYSYSWDKNLFRGWREAYLFWMLCLCRSRKDIFRPLVSVSAKCFSLSITKVCQKLNIKNLVSLLLDK